MNLSDRIIQQLYRDPPAWVGWVELLTSMQVEPATSEDAVVLATAVHDLAHAGLIELRVSDGIIHSLRLPRG